MLINLGVRKLPKNWKKLFKGLEPIKIIFGPIMKK